MANYFLTRIFGMARMRFSFSKTEQGLAFTETK